jgi:glycosyltransferase involved in cell wall biosynthesis
MNIFIGAYACEPHKGSEPEVGWQMVNEIAKAMPDDHIYVVTKYNNQELIKKEEYPKNIKFFYYDPPKWLTFWKKGGRGVRTYYYIWMLTAALFMKKQNIKFDIVHHVTFVNDWLPSFYHLLKTKENKFIWGPIGSHDAIEAKFLDENKRKFIEKIRMFLQFFYRTLDPSFRICKAKADCIVGITQNVKSKLNLNINEMFIAEPAIAMNESSVMKIKKVDNDNDDFTILSVGRLLYIKNFTLTILSFSYFLKNNPDIINAKLKIIGEGSDKKSLENFTQELGIQEKVEFVGQIPRSEVQKSFYNANLFLFPTLESAGFVTLEAMSNYLPVVAMKYGGPQEFVKHNVEEQLVSYDKSYDDIAKSLAKKIENFYFNKELCEKVGKQNHKDILDNFTWEAKAQKMKKLYLELLNEI